MKKLMTILLCLAMAAGLWGCGETAAPEATAAPETTEAPTEAPTTEATKPQILTEAALTEALNTTGFATLDGDITLTREVLVGKGMLDGNGHAVVGAAYAEGQTETENAVTVTGGTVQNLSITGDYRCIGDNADNRVSGDVRLKDVTVDGPTYALNFGYGTGSTNLYVEDSTLLGWSSYTKFQEAIFTNCTFGWDSTGSNGNLRPYIDTTLIGCHFEGKTEEDGTVTPFNIKFKQGSDGIILTLEDCYVGETLITEENAADLLGLDLQGNVLRCTNSN